VIGVEQIPAELTRSYGVVGVAEDERGHKRIHTIVEKPAAADAPSDLGVVGRYVLSPRIFQLLHGVRAGVGGEIQLTDGIAALLKHETVLALPFVGKRYDCGSREGYIRATIDHALELDDLREPILAHIRDTLGRLERS
jgi:UTP--glucose-1-phosphate uridylyltransferase